MPGSTGAKTLDLLPTFDAVLERAVAAAASPGGASRRRRPTIRVELQGRTSASNPPAEMIRSCVMDVPTARRLLAHGRERARDNGCSIVVFRDFTVAAQEIGGRAWVRRLNVADRMDLSADASDIASRAGDAWLTPEEVLARSTPPRPDPGGQALIARLEDLLIADPCASTGRIMVCRESPDFEALCDFHALEPVPGMVEFIEAVTAHAVRCVVRECVWSFRQQDPFLHLASSWDRCLPAQTINTPALPASAVLRAPRRREAASRTLSWLATTDAPASLIATARLRLG